jgi:hypothetical protein
VKIFTIGFTRTSAAHFFGRLKAAGVTRLIDVRLNRNSQLSGFAKECDLAWSAAAPAAGDQDEGGHWAAPGR